jgi:hypothetical protein
VKGRATLRVLQARVQISYRDSTDGSAFAICTHWDSPTLKNPNIFVAQKVGYCRSCSSLPETRLLSECGNLLHGLALPSRLAYPLHATGTVYFSLFSLVLELCVVSMIGVKKPA